ncbi:TPA: helix-turn-helix transcriptional regulator [Listeria monocytogenes]
MNNTISQWIKDVRKTSGYNQKDFASKVLGKSKRHMIRLENMEANLSLKEFFQITACFNIDIASTLNIMLESENNIVDMETLLDLAKDPTYDSNELLSKIELLEDKAISNYYQVRLELMRSFINFKETKDETYLKYFIEHINTDSIEGFRILNCSLYVLTNDQIVKCIASLKENDFQKKAEILNKLLINAIGILVNRKYRDFDYINHLFKTAKEFTLKNREYIYLPILYFHMAIFNRNIDNQEEYNFYKEKAILLAEIYENEEMLNNIKKEI